MLKFSISISYGGIDVVIDVIDSLLDEERRCFIVEKIYLGIEVLLMYFFFLWFKVKIIFW